ncbi:hypothetical protein DF185_20940 [Marinifilum breve]|uniref:Uncharacterized protein n=1 Tax=Marinifilum breve TaxID=2184082 RepID=A0A2V3ZSB7_9BACT|nr:hypothetical protein [Marinifilum breve]PXX96027.1 hypothetical protein DF185_20940 [Marinifilum breve]
MKTTKYYKLLASIVLVSTLTTYTTSLFAQRRSYNEEATRYEERKRNKSFHENNNKDRSKRSSYNYKDDRRSQRHDHKYKNKKSHYSNHDHYSHKKHKGHKHYKHHKHGHVEHRYYHGDHYRGHHRYHHRHHAPYYRHKHYYNKHGHSCYNHSKYGQVIWRFSCEPRVIHYHSGDYYYTNGYYYRYYPEFGFIHVEPPRAVYFSHLPNDCHRVKVHGGVYYTDGDLCFVRHRKGFRLVTMPEGIHFSIRF